jgi:hypothetical protein
MEKRYPKMIKEIEENCWTYLEAGSQSGCYKYLKKLGFDDNDIDWFFERWYEGKSLYPYD